MGEMQTWLDDGFWAGTRAPLGASTGLQPAAYTDNDFFADEQQRVYERAWVCIGLRSEATPGRMLVRSLGSRSIVVTNDGTALHGFFNTCRHRGTELAEADCDVRGTIRCPYHRWGYSLDGTLVATPFFNEVPRLDFDAADFSLAPVRIEAWGCLLFACADPATPPLTEWLGDLPERMAGYNLDSWVPRHEQELEIRANWKLISENFQEYYHLTWVHPELSKVSRVQDHYRYQGPGMYCGQTTTPVTADERDDWLSMPPAPGLDQSDAVSGRFVAIFPNVLLSVLPNHVFVMRFDPKAPGRTLETCSWLVPEQTGDVSDDAFEPTRSFWLEVNAEDIDIVERGQRGLTRGAVSPGPLAPRFEEPLHRFQRMLADHMTSTDMSGISIPSGDQDADDRFGTATNPTPPTIERSIGA